MLENAAADPKKKWGTWKIPYGKTNRLQRVAWNQKGIVRRWMKSLRGLSTAAGPRGFSYGASSACIQTLVILLMIQKPIMALAAIIM